MKVVGRVLILFALALISWGLGYFNTWTWIWRGAAAAEPPSWIFWLADARLPGLLFCGGVGALVGGMTGVRGGAWILVPAALFPGILSLPGAWAAILAEEIGVVLRRGPRGGRLVLASLLLLAVGVWGDAWRDWGRELWQATGLLPTDSFLVWMSVQMVLTLELELGSAAWASWRRRT